MEIRQPIRVQHTFVQAIEAAPDAVFPLLCPVREADWIDGWNPDWVLSESGLVERGCIFQTPSGEEGVPPAVWVVTEHDPHAYRVAMIKVIPGLTVTTLRIELADDGDGGTRSAVTYGYTALSEAGEALVGTYTADWYRDFMQKWEAGMNHYLATGEPMTG